MNKFELESLVLKAEEMSVEIRIAGAGDFRLAGVHIFDPTVERFRKAIEEAVSLGCSVVFLHFWKS